MKSSEIHIRDPFVFVEDGRYIMLGTTDKEVWGGTGKSFLAYESKDLQDWTLAGPLFEGTPDFWGTMDYWAPEMHKYNGSYYLFASFKAPDRCRATCILKSDSPLGPFKPWGAEQVTPMDWECLDGTLYVDEDGKPWLVFCHEWLQVFDGEMCALPLKEDLSGPAGEPTLLFRASEAPWVVTLGKEPEPRGNITDGPFLFRGESGKLCMLWSSFGKDGYAIGVASSEGGLMGPWKQEETPFFGRDGGHGMLFTTLCGKLLLSIHAPNKTPDERPLFIPVAKTGDTLKRLDQ